MSRHKTFAFEFTIAGEFLRKAPDEAAEIVSVQQDEIARREFAIGPRGGFYQMVTEPDEWRSSDQAGDDWMRDLVRYHTRRTGRYVPPKRLAFERRTA